MKKVIISVVGKDTVGIIARTATYLSGANVNILDISQTVVQGYFHMMMIVDVAKCDIPFARFAAEVSALGAEIGVDVHVQRSEIFEKMHRV